MTWTIVTVVKCYRLTHCDGGEMPIEAFGVEQSGEFCCPSVTDDLWNLSDSPLASCAPGVFVYLSVIEWVSEAVGWRRELILVKMAKRVKFTQVPPFTLKKCFNTFEQEELRVSNKKYSELQSESKFWMTFKNLGKKKNWVNEAKEVNFQTGPWWTNKGVQSNRFMSDLHESLPATDSPSAEHTRVQTEKSFTEHWTSMQSSCCSSYDEITDEFKLRRKWHRGGIDP